VPPTELVEALRDHDVGLIINRPVTRNDELVFPNKLFEYLMAGLAVAVPRLPGMAPLVESERVGVTYEPGRLADALAELGPDELTAMQRRGRELALSRLNAETQADVLERVWRP
jgi:glycosyltransferase involved in cell wall biosynthesis